MRPIIEMLSAGFFIFFITSAIVSDYEIAIVCAPLFTLCVCTLAICESIRESSK